MLNINNWLWNTSFQFIKATNTNEPGGLGNIKKPETSNKSNHLQTYMDWARLN